MLHKMRECIISRVSFTIGGIKLDHVVDALYYFWIDEYITFYDVIISLVSKIL